MLPYVACSFQLWLFMSFYDNEGLSFFWYCLLPLMICEFVCPHSWLKTLRGDAFASLSPCWRRPSFLRTPSWSSQLLVLPSHTRAFPCRLCDRAVAGTSSSSISCCPTCCLDKVFVCNIIDCEKHCEVVISNTLSFIFGPVSPLQAKYSPLHTCRVQLLGAGRYLLFPPAKQSSLYLYPAIHTSHQQSQVSWLIQSLVNKTIKQGVQMIHVCAVYIFLCSGKWQKCVVVYSHHRTIPLYPSGPDGRGALPGCAPRGLDISPLQVAGSPCCSGGYTASRRSAVHTPLLACACRVPSAVGVSWCAQSVRGIGEFLQVRVVMHCNFALVWN